MRTKVDLERKIKDVDVGLLDEPGPQDDEISNILLALFHIGQNSSDPKGFWIRAQQINEWLNANGIDIKLVIIGQIMFRDLGFNLDKRLADGKYRWVQREKLGGLISKFNDGNTVVQVSGSHYDAVKRQVFNEYLSGGDVSELDCDMVLVQKASQEFTAMGNGKAQAWLDGE